MPSEKYQKRLWEVLVPKASNSSQEYTLSHHQGWDSQVRAIARGLTIFKKARGQWISPEGELFNEEMIPVRIFCSQVSLDRILDITLDHYDQKAVMAYEISTKVVLKYKKTRKQ